MHDTHDDMAPASTASPGGCGREDVPGIVIRDGCGEHGADRVGPRVQAFVYGEAVPALPTLPFGRWRVAS
jgi:hypothetical protein